MSNIPELQNVPEVSFIDNLTLEEVREEMLRDYTGKYQELTGEGADLSDADPTKLVLLSFAQHFYQALQYVDWAGKKNLLKYSYGEALDNLASNKGLERNQASYATTTLEFTTQNARASATGIPAGTRVCTLTGVYFMTASYVEIPAGELSTTVQGVALDPGAASNGQPVGTIDQIVDPAPYIYAVRNTTVSAGGADAEDDDSLTRRAFLFPASYSTAGAEAAYIYWAKTFRSDVTDVKAYSPAASHATVLFMLDTGLPTSEDIAGMTEHLSAKKIRPMTDRLTVMAPAVVTYNIELTYYIDTADASQAVTIQNSVAQAVEAYIAWQRVIGRDINPTELIYRIRAAGAKRAAVISPAYTTVDAESVPMVGTVSVTYGGLEEG